MRHATVTLLLLLATPLLANERVESGDTSVVSLDSLIVTSRRYTAGVRTGVLGTVRWDMTMMEDMPKILGNADPVHYAQMLPGIQTNSELRAGLSIQGCDNAHTQYSVNGVPLYNVAHLLGIFSTFNASHYPSLLLEKTPLKGASPLRLGGSLDMQLPDHVEDSVSGVATVGAMSSQGTLRIPIRKKTQLFLSGRGSYLNLFYGPLLKIDDSRLEYSFFDVNATLLHVFDEQNRLLVDFYMGQDRASVSDDDYYNDTRAHWGNHEAAVHWLYGGTGEWEMKHTLYNTRYFNRFNLDMPDVRVALPSSIMDFGYKGRAQWRDIAFGADFVYHSVQPQDPSVESSFNVVATPQEPTYSKELSLWGDYTRDFSSKWTLSTGLRYTLYHTGEECFHEVDPSALITWRPMDAVSISAGYALRHQNLFQAGFSSIGLPVEFWFSAGGVAGSPQWEHGPTASFAFSLWDGRYKLSLDAYYKRLYNQVEYSGNPYDFINTVYSLDKSLLHGDGKNYGCSVMLAKCTGKLTGWVSYSWGRALRIYDYPQLSGTFPANHERIHELDVVATWHVKPRWTLGATYVLASGTPFTAPKAFYMVNGKVMAQFGEHNANRLPLYSRLDVSVNCRLGNLAKRCQHFLNLSIYNLTYRNNPLHYYLKVYEGRFAYKPLNMFISIIPSVSYTLKF